MKTVKVILAIPLMIVVTCVLGDSSHDEKRLLLSDPTYIQQQLQSLQTEIQDLKTKQSQYENTISQQETKLHDQETKLHDQETKLHDLNIKVQSQETKIQNQDTIINSLHDQRAKNVSGRVYTRWGKKTCPGNATLVYSGFTAGSKYTDTGTSGLSICLPQDPIFSSLIPKESVSLIYGTEYELNLDSQQIFDDDVPCAVCMSTAGSEILMLPGRNRCYDRWNEEYNGYLVGPKHDHAYSMDYVCLDNHPDVLFGGGTNQNGHLLYLSVTKCGSLKCPPYVDNKVVTCVVCSQ